MAAGNIKVSLVLRILLAALMLIAAALKWADPSVFQQKLLAYPFMNYPLSFIVASWIPSFELVIGFTLLFRSSARWALVILMMMLAGFSILLGWAWFQGWQLDCGCFGEMDFASSPPQALLRNVILLTMAGLSLWCMRPVATTDGTGISEPLN